jgi:hypothetical protein
MTLFVFVMKDGDDHISKLEKSQQTDGILQIKMSQNPKDHLLYVDI